MNKIKIIAISLTSFILLAGCTSLKENQQNAQIDTTIQIIPTTLSDTTEAENTQVPIVTLESSSPTQFSDSEMVLANYNDINASFNRAIKTTGWIRQVSTSSTFDERNQMVQDFGVNEEWYRFDADGHLKAYYSWLTSPEGAVEQEVYLLENGKLYNVTLNETGQGETTTEIDFTGGFADGLKTGKNISQENVVYQGLDAWKFSYNEKQDAVLTFSKVIYFDVTTGLILGKETWLLEPEGTTKLVSSTIINNFEINADPPMDRFQQMMEMGPKQ